MAMRLLQAFGDLDGDAKGFVDLEGGSGDLSLRLFPST